MSDPKPRDNQFRCGVCGQLHDFSMSYSVKVPEAVAAIPEAELDQRVEFTLDQCIIDRRAFYLRGRIAIPVVDSSDDFIWGVWAQVGERDFVRSIQMWKVEGREREPPFEGWLNTPLPLYKGTLNLQLSVITKPVGRRPHFEVVDQEHPLAIEQVHGISMRRVQEIAETFIHTATGAPSARPRGWNG